jgi:BirA family biotin operon repressor/biotin-[acetyl-CoA-carboxylase] ligase
MKFETFKFESVTSTNDVAINLIKEKKSEIGCVCANKQTKGRGTHGKSWISDEGNLFISIFFQLKDSYPSFNEFSMINPVIISEIIEHFCKKKDVSIKWPNDVFVNRKKICGILQELITLNDKKFLIIGIGINILTNPNVNTEYQTTNILLEAKKKPQIMEIINLILFSYEKFFSNLNSYDYISFKKKAEQKIVN